MNRRLSPGLVSLLAAPLLAIGAGSAQATLCEVSMERAYQEAQVRGWQFRCSVKVGKGSSPYNSSAVVHFDNHKRLGCRGKTGYKSGSRVVYRFQAKFFSKPGTGSGNALMNGWSIDSYQVIGGNHNQSSPSSFGKLSYGWTSDKANTWTNRYLSKIIFKKHAGNCNTLYNEAFG